jgi:hypothetical protein
VFRIPPGSPTAKKLDGKKLSGKNKVVAAIKNISVLTQGHNASA